MTVLQVCAFAAPNPGNFIASLTNLEKELKKKGIKTIYAFSDGAKNFSWCKNIAKRTKVYFLPTANARILPDTYKIIKKIYKENNISIVHSHFELYDIPVTVMANKKIKVYWHLHDPLELKKDSRYLLWKIQYSLISKKATLISVAEKYRQDLIKFGLRSKQSTVILNGIDTTRIDKNCYIHNVKEYDFATFGWDFYRKGDDIIIEACKKLYNEGYKFKLLLNGNQSTWEKLNEYTNNQIPEYIVKSDPVDDVNIIFSKSNLFIQASRRETFSYAVCEAAYSGLPVISSDISGLEWAKEVPTVKFFKSENIDELYLLMKDSLNNRIIANSDIKTSQDIIDKKFSIQAWTKNILEVYKL